MVKSISQFQFNSIFILTFCLFTSSNSLSQGELIYRIEKLPLNINTGYEEVKPMSSENGDTLFFIRTSFPENAGGKYADEDIWFTYQTTDNKWYRPTNNIFGMNDTGANIFAGLGSNSEIIYLFNYVRNGKRRFLGISAFNINSGTVVKEIIDHSQTIEIDDDFHDLYLHPNEGVLLISMRSMNTIGLEDIYISVKEENGTWSRPVNLGASINSRGFEISPFLSDDGTVLYFSSNGHGGFGDADIYCSSRKDDSWTNWSKPKNMGHPFNSSKFDAYLSKNKNGDFFMASNRRGKFSDIYIINIIETHSVAQTTPPKDLNPSFSQELKPNDSQSPQDSLILFFDFDQFELNQMEHNKLHKFIADNLSNQTNFQCNISGYTDDTGSSSYNRKLSLKRAKTISKIMRKAGIARHSISVEGKGIFPISNNQEITPDQMRRVLISFSTME